MKTCPRCREYKPLSEFHPRTSYCKPCSVAYNREWRRAHPGRQQAYKKKSESLHSETTRRGKRRRYHADVEHSRELQRAWYANHPGAIAERNAAQRERRRKEGLYAWYKYGLDLEMRAKLMERQHDRCPICDRELTGETHPTVDHDHVTGKIRGILCHRCNRWLARYDERRAAIEAYVAPDMHFEPLPRRRYPRAAPFSAAAQTS